MGRSRLVKHWTLLYVCIYFKYLTVKNKKNNRFMLNHLHPKGWIHLSLWHSMYTHHGSPYCIVPSKDGAQSVVVPRVPVSYKMTHLHKGCHKFFRVSRDVTVFFRSYLVPLARCWIDTPVSVGAEHRSLPQSARPQGWKERGKRAICLEQHSPSCTKNAETERRCTDLCKIHYWTLHDGRDRL